MKIVAMIPFWQGYNPNTGEPLNRALRKLGGVPVINYSLKLLNRSRHISDVIVFTSFADLGYYIEPSYDFKVVDRPKYLDHDDICIEQIIQEFLSLTDADIVVLMHPNSPFIQLDTLNDCIERVLSRNYDSAFTAYTLKKFTWFQGAPLNYSMYKNTPRLSELEPVTVEQSSLYVFTRAIFNESNKRLGGRAYKRNINHFEGHDLMQEEDFDLAELIVNSGMFSDLP